MDERLIVAGAGAAGAGLLLLGEAVTDVAADTPTSPKPPDLSQYDHVTTFENGRGSWDGGNRTSSFDVVQTRGAGDSGRSLRCTVGRGQHWGGNLYRHLPGPTAVSARFDVYLPDSFAMPDDSHTCKLFWAAMNASQGGGHSGGTRPDGTNGFSHRVYLRGTGGSRVRPGSYVYHMDQSRQYGDEILWPDSLSLGQWHTIETYTLLNTPGQADGACMAWLNGSKQIEETGLRFRSQQYGMDRFGPGLYWGGSETAPAANAVFYDNVAFRSE